jgi:dipeptidyl aminopeptidase/acylaminoacyl peptidase
MRACLTRRRIGAQPAAAALGAILLSCALSRPVAAVEAPAPASVAVTAQAPKPLTLAEFLAPAEISLLSISPKGDRIAYVLTENGIDALIVQVLGSEKKNLLLWTTKADAREEKAKQRQYISYLSWKSDARLVATVVAPYADDSRREAVWRSVAVHYVVDADGDKKAMPINEKNADTRSAKVERSSILDPLRNDPDHILMEFVPFGFWGPEIDRVDIRDGSRVVLERPDANVLLFGVDRKGNIVTRYVAHVDGTVTVEGRAVGEKRWVKLFDIAKKTLKAASDWAVLAPGGDDVLYVTARRDVGTGDTQEVRTYNLRTATLGPVVWSHPKYDVEDIILSERTGELLAGCYWADVYECDFKDPALQANLKGLSTYFHHARSIVIASKSDDDKTWILHVDGPEEPAAYYLYDVTAHRVENLGDRFPQLSADRLGRMRRFEYQAADKTPLFAYVTEPPGAGPGPLPLVVMPHGGPEVRDYLGYDTWVQFLATRGYVVLQPNFRGSGGFGRKFAEAGYREWGGLMHDDVTQAVKALIASGRVDPSRICIVGASYGGYEALWAAHAEPDLYKCAVSIDGLSDLTADMNWQRQRGVDSIVYKYLAKVEGDPKVDSDRMAAKSPITYAKSWTTPVLLIHGDQDDNVDVSQSRRMNQALLSEHKSVRYVEVKKMGHGPETDDETTQVFGAIETFLAPYLKPAVPPAPITKTTDASKP